MKPALHRTPEIRTSFLRRADMGGVRSWAAACLVAATSVHSQTIPNRGFEENAVFTNPPGYSDGNAAIIGWSTNNPARVGLNPGTNFSDFADNGKIPNGGLVAFIQSTGSFTALSTTITGLKVGTWYRVQFRATSRNASAFEANPSIRLNGGAAMRFAAPVVFDNNPYNTISAIFKATATTAALEVSNTSASDTTLLVDQFLITAATPIVVTKTTDDNSAGTLRKTLADAASTPEFNIITFAAGLNGGTITLTDQIAVDDTGGVAIDATSLSNGLTIHGGSDVNRIFLVGNAANATVLALRRLTLTSGDLPSTGGQGGAIKNSARLFLEQCTLHGNSAENEGGAIFNGNTGSLSLVQCTLSDNSATNPVEAEGGALYNDTFGVVSLTHCTIAGNSSEEFGDAITNFGTLTTTHSIISQTLDNYGGTVIRVGANLIGTLDTQNSGSEFGSTHSTADPLLSAIAPNGGPTQTMALGNTSPARNASVDSTITTDQRGLPVVGTPDLGAFEAQGGGTFTLSATTYAAAEGGVAEIIINRGGNISGVATVRLTTTAGTATTADFTARANSAASDVFFLDGETTKTIAIPLTADALTEGNHSFTVTLSTPTPAGATVGTPATATVTISDAIMVNTVADEFDSPSSGPNVSLREALRDAAAVDGPNAIGFAPALAGQTLTLTSGEFNVTDTGGVTIDASSVGGVTLSGNNATRHFEVSTSGASLTLRRLTLTAGNGIGGSGGAIMVGNSTAVTLMDCTLSGNNAEFGGAIANTDGTTTLTRCTLLENSADYGGAVYSATPNGDTVRKTSLTQCTLSGNTATTSGGGIHNGSGLATLVHCTVAGNTAPAGEGAGLASYGNNATETVVDKCLIARNLNGGNVDMVGENANNSFTSAGFNVIGSGDATGDFNVTGDIINVADPLLAALANNGGPTKTHALLSGSQALDRATGSIITRDQRGFMRNGAADSGAFEAGQGGGFGMSLSNPVLEGQPLTVTINRTRAFSGSASVRLYTSNLSATGGVDFAARPNTAASDVLFADGETSKTVVIPTTPDTIAEPANESFLLALGSFSPAPVAFQNGIGSVAITIVDPIVVTNTNDDGPGSLRQAFRTAAISFNPDVISFAAALNGQTITLGSEIAVDDADGVTVDATGLAAGITIDGGPGTNRIFIVGNSTATNLILRRLTLTGGNGTSALASNEFGGAILNLSGSTLTMTECTLSGNSAAFGGGGITNNGTALLTQCTISGNSAGSSGGGITNYGTALLTQCTVSGNSAGGSGGGIVTFTGLTLDRNIVAGNTATGSPASADISNWGDPIATKGVNIVNALTGPISGSSGSIIQDIPLDLGPLASNGGPTKTHALLPGSPAIDAATGSTVTTDQRGLPIIAAADIGAYEAQLGGTFVLSAPGYSVNEGSDATVTIHRLGGLQGTATVRLFTTPGTASASDFTGRQNLGGLGLPGSDVFFDDGVGSVMVSIQTTPEPTNIIEANESFSVTLGSPSAGCTLGAPLSANVAIIDPSSAPGGVDTMKPTVTISTPAAGASVNVDAGGNLTVTGTAKDSQGVQRVHVFLNASTSQLATLDKPGATNVNWSATFPGAIAGSNTVQVFSEDFADGFSPSTFRTFKVLRPLLVGISGFGTVTKGYAPKSYREVGAPQTIAATAGAGYLFAGWTVPSGHTNSPLGVDAVALQKSPLTFIHRDALTGQTQPLSLMANFVPNPFTPAVIGIYNGGIKPSITLPVTGGSGPGGTGTASKLDTEGYLSAKVESTGAFTGSMKIDGLTLPLAGVFDQNGVARFGNSRATSLSVARTGKPALVVALSINTSTQKIAGTVAQFDGVTLTAASEVDADRAFYSATNPVPSNAFNATPLATPPRPATGTYTMYLYVIAAGTLTSAEVPQGYSHGTVTLSSAGVVTVALKLADGATMTQSTTISQSGRWRLFAQLYAGLQGLLADTITFNHATLGSDWLSENPLWICPLQNRQHYPLGWPNGIKLGNVGSKLVVEAGKSVVGITEIPTTGGNGNATILLDPALATDTKTVEILPTDAVIQVSTGTYSLRINRSTGAIKGSFLRSDGTTVSYSGSVFQKFSGAEKVFGYFLTPTPKVKDYTGQSGLVLLRKQ